jgi:UDP-N-acetylglucosamine--N-acetylmuramyl-(pentapeptide) pyrophosphoryl-undecaprenol N-acetylglucosamine transferase
MSNAMIVFTGGGTAGHVTPNVALIEASKAKGFAVAYIGSEKGIEKQLMNSLGVPFYSVASGKLRRYFSLKTALAPFEILLGISQSLGILRSLKPKVVFSKGGFVAFPVVVAAWLCRIPVIAHESDLSPGLANRLSFPFAQKICLTFAAAATHFKRQEKIEVTGTPIRAELFTGDPRKALGLCGFEPDKPCLLIIGGSLGSEHINQTVRGVLEKLLARFQIIHLCGKGKIDAALLHLKGYRQFEYLSAELADCFALASLVISRAGANSLYELLALKKLHVLIPLSAKVSRGDQVQNARYTEELGISVVVQDDELNGDRLIDAIDKVLSRQAEIEKNMAQLKIQSATDRLLGLISQIQTRSCPTV